MKSLNGPDGLFSWRKFFSIISWIAGMTSLFVAQFQEGDPLLRLVPGIVMLIFGSVLYGIMTVQNILSITKIAKGLPDNAPKEEVSNVQNN